MEIGTCLVALGGDLLNQVVKRNVTPAEVIVLRFLHGPDAVRDLKKTGDVDRPNASEMRRLAEFYDAHREDDKRVLPKLFPGVRPSLPKKFSELATEEDLADDEESEAAETAAVVVPPQEGADEEELRLKTRTPRSRRGEVLE